MNWNWINLLDLKDLKDHLTHLSALYYSTNLAMSIEVLLCATQQKEESEDLKGIS